MATSTPTVERALRKLQQAARRKPGSGEAAVITRELPLDLTDGRPQSVGMMADELNAGDTAVVALLADLRFEHLGGGPWFRGMQELGGKVEETVVRFADQCRLDRKTDHVPAFIEQHAQEPVEDVFYVPVEFLTVEAETQIAGVRLLPVNDPQVLAALKGPHVPQQEGFSLDKPVGCVAAADERGTNPGRMSLRARWAIEHALRVLRVGLTAVPGIDDSQLRFRRGFGQVSSEGHIWWQGRGDAVVNLALAADLSPVLSQPVASLSAEPATDIDKQADLALGWMERACLEGDGLPALLFRFFALEALLGDKSEGLKAHGLAFRQAQLAYVSTGTFGHPTDVWLLYDEVRSVAVHGGQVRQLDWRDAESARSMISETLNQYLTLAREHGLIKRSQLRKLLDEHPSRAEVIKWLRESGGPIWTDYLNSLMAS